MYICRQLYVIKFKQQRQRLFIRKNIYKIKKNKSSKHYVRSTTTSL